MIKVMTIVGTRPEIIKLSLVIKELDKFTDHVLVHTGQNFDHELNQIFFEDLELRLPDYYLNAAEEYNQIGTISNVLKKVDELLAEIKPDAVLIYGDTNSCLSVIAAKKRKIPIFHMEAGNRSFSQIVPEEVNRKIVDHLSDINMTITEHARRYLLAEGIKPETVFKIGSSMKEVLIFYQEKIKKSNILNNLGVSPEKYFLVSIHREENVDNAQAFKSLLDGLNLLSENYPDKKIIVSTHPRTRKRLNKDIESKLRENIEFLKPFSFTDYIFLQQNSFCILSDSGTLTEEASLLNLKAIMIRNMHERPEGMDEGTLVMSGLEPKKILKLVQVVSEQAIDTLPRIVGDYNVDNVSKKVLKIILSYTDYVNRSVWNK